jgi:hypothetical protein
MSKTRKKGAMPTNAAPEYPVSEPIRQKPHFLLHCTEVARQVVEYALDAFERSMNAKQLATQTTECGPTWSQEIDNLHWLVNRLSFLDNYLLSDDDCEKDARRIFGKLAAKHKRKGKLHLLFFCITVFRWSAHDMAESLSRCQKLNGDEQVVMGDGRGISSVVFRVTREVRRLADSQIVNNGFAQDCREAETLLRHECRAANDQIAENIRARAKYRRQQAKAKKAAV